MTPAISLDIRTLYVALASVACFFGVILLGFSVLTERTRGVLLWGIAYLGVAAGLTLLLLNDYVPPILHGPLASSLFVLASVLLDAGVRSPEDRFQWFYDLLVPSLALVLFLVFTFVFDRFTMRLEIMLVAIAIETVRASVRLIHQAREADGTARTGLMLFAGFFTLMALVVSVLAIVTPILGPVSGSMAGSTLHAIMIPGLMLFLIGAGLGQLWVHYIRAYLDVQRAATTDPLTGVRNRRYVMPEYERLFQRAQREGTRLACLMLDADDFKGINDTHGHRKGDDVLVQLAQRLTAAVRQYDLVGRYGGEEFIVIVPGLPSRDVISVAERIHESIRGEPVAGVRLTVCIGVAFLAPDDTRPEDLVHRADLALLAAKRAGKDRIEVDEDGMEKAV